MLMLEVNIKSPTNEDKNNIENEVLNIWNKAGIILVRYTFLIMNHNL